MATLTEVAFVARRVIKLGGIGFVAILSLRFLIITGVAMWRQANPAPPPPPTVAFGKLPRLEFPQAEEKNYTFSLQLPTLSFPEFSDRAKVFLMPYRSTSFLAADVAISQAKNLGFLGQPQTLSSEIYSWVITSPVTTKLDMNIIDGSFVYDYSWSQDPNIGVAKNLPGQEAAVAETKKFIAKAKELSQDLVVGESKVEYLRQSGNKLIPSVSYSEALFVRVDLFRANIEDMPVVTSQPSRGLVSALLSGSQNRRFLKVQYNYFPVDYNTNATYPIKTAGQAYDELVGGKGYIASYTSEKKDIVVRRVYLGFYDTFSPADFLQPIYIFTGDDDFIAYVPAIVDTWYQ